MRAGKLISLVALLFIHPGLRCQTVGIEGSGKNYEGAELRIFIQSDPVSRREKPLLRLSCSDSGSFSCEIPVDGNRLVIIKSGIYAMPLYVSAGGYYEIRMPDFQPRPAGEENNPFFIEATVIPEVINDIDDRNNFIRQFDAEFNPVFNLVAERISLNYKVGEIDEEISRLNSAVSGRNDAFSSDYVNFRLMMLDNVASGTYEGRIVDSALINRAFLADNPAYLDLIEQKFAFCFRNIAAGAGSERFMAAIYSSPVDSLRSIVASYARISEPELLDYVILMNLYSGYYEGLPGRGPVTRLTGELMAAGASGYIKKLASTLLDNIVSLLPGMEPPSFSLPDTSGRLYNPGSFSGRYLLLSFAGTHLTSTLLEFGILKMWYSKYTSDLQIVTIIRDRSFSEAARRMSDSGFGWIFLDGTREDILDYDYNIRMYPSFVLIGRDGKIINSTCPMPSENLEVYFRSFLTREKDSLSP